MSVKLRIIFFFLAGMVCLTVKNKAHAEEYTYTYEFALHFVSEPTNIRSKPSVEGELLGQLPAGSCVTVFGRCNETGWYEILGDTNTDRDCYISDKYVMDFSLNYCCDKVQLFYDTDIIKWPEGTLETVGSIEKGATFAVKGISRDETFYYIDNKYGKGFIPASKCVMPTTTSTPKPTQAPTSTPKPTEAVKSIFAPNEKGEPWYVRLIYFLFKLFILAVVVLVIVFYCLGVKGGIEESEKRIKKAQNERYLRLTESEYRAIMNRRREKALLREYRELLEEARNREVRSRTARSKASSRDDFSSFGVFGADWDDDGEVSMLDDVISMDIIDDEL